MSLVAGPYASLLQKFETFGFVERLEKYKEKAYKTKPRSEIVLSGRKQQRSDEFTQRRSLDSDDEDARTNMPVTIQGCTKIDSMYSQKRFRYSLPKPSLHQ